MPASPLRLKWLNSPGSRFWPRYKLAISVDDHHLRIHPNMTGAAAQVHSPLPVHRSAVDGAVCSFHAGARTRWRFSCVISKMAISVSMVGRVLTRLKQQGRLVERPSAGVPGRVALCDIVFTPCANPSSTHCLSRARTYPGKFEVLAVACRP